MLNARVGQIVKSKAGRDKGNYMIIYKVIDKDYVLLVDGLNRKVENPKKKKIKHLQLTSEMSYEIVEAFKSGIIPTNDQIKKILHKKVNLPQL
jgi:large subunit ribosomal protein L14e